MARDKGKKAMQCCGILRSGKQCPNRATLHVIYPGLYNESYFCMACVFEYSSQEDYIYII